MSSFRHDLSLRPDAPPTRRARIFNTIIRNSGRRLWASSASTDDGLVRFRRINAALRSRAPRGVRITPHVFEDFSAEWVRAGETDDGKVVLYLHGGGYFFGSPIMYRGLSWRLSAATRRPVLVLDYRLAPENTPADALEDAVTAYDFLLAMGYAAQDVVVGGDSAGGHLALSLLHALKRRGSELPSAVVAISPWADLLCASDSHTANADGDHVIPAVKLKWLGEQFCKAAAEGDPLFDPVHGDYKGFPPLMLISSSTEILRDDARNVAARAAAAGVEVVHREWNDQAHVFPVFADYVPEGKAAIADIAEFLRSR
ncbi:alpha/beta hydrolase [Actinocorallia sp. A-T 12471]|uniref:alpha/beta hydrolase n=1 Tax=Actinocorallia sp. A-T 12471 TaxID=3089813 RepID=UPI0029CF0C4F|nr:alpha/beta hydrolase [Actinocorallia sp. A-T 12471]MDX6738603.1 alpha/beta hydrolase [Actinocorallia sp. A-T 12471]